MLNPKYHLRSNSGEVDPSGQLNFGDAPGGDLSFDDLFPNPEGDPIAPTTAPGTTSDPTPPQEPQAPAPVTPTPEDFYLKAGETVYKSKEDAIHGISHKDAVIEQLRQRFIFERGVDPLTNQPVQIQGSQQPQANPNYLQDRQRYFNDLIQAVEAQNPDAYLEAQTKLIFDVLEPLQPLIQDLSRQQATKTVQGEITEFDKFYGSQDYQAVLNDQPALKEAIGLAESNYRLSGQLPGLYKLAYWASQGRRLPDLLKAAQQPSAAPVPPTRPTTSPVTNPPPTTTARPDIRTAEGRKAIIAQLEGTAGNWKF